MDCRQVRSRDRAPGPGTHPSRAPGARLAFVLMALALGPVPGGAIPVASLVVDKTDSRDPVQVGERFSYTITVSASSTQTGAELVQVFDTLPGEVTLVETRGCAEDPDGVPTCTMPGFQPGESAQYVVTVEAVRPGTAVNTVNAIDPLQGLASGSGSETTTIVAPPAERLQVDKRDTADPVRVGETFSYRIQVTNPSTQRTAFGVTVTDALPGPLTLVGTQGCAEDPNGVPLCTLGDLGPGQSRSYTIQVRAGAAGTATNSATAAARGFQDGTGIQTTRILPPVPRGGRLVVRKIDTPDPVTVGERVQYTISVTNAGQATATNVRVIDTLPPGLAFVSTEGCAGQPGYPVCLLGDLAPHQTKRYVLHARAVRAGLVTNRATALTSSPGYRSTGATQTTRVLPRPQLAVSKSGPDQPVEPAEPFTYTVVVTNRSEREVTEVVALDTLPEGLSLEATSGCRNDPQGVPRCILGPLAGHATARYEIRVRALRSGRFVNRVRVTAPGAEPAEATATTEVLPPPLVIVPEALPEGTVNVPYSAQFDLRGGTPPARFELVDPAALPPDLALAGSRLTGTPLDAGAYPFTLRARDARGREARRAYVLRILPNALRVVTTRLPDAVSNAPYAAQLLASGGREPYRWEAAGLLPGLRLDPLTGTIFGRPERPEGPLAAPGVLTETRVDARVQDSRGDTAARGLRLRLLAGGLENQTPPLPHGRVGTPYRAPLLIAGAQGEPTCRLVAGALPPGLAVGAPTGSCIDGIAGTPERAGVFDFVVEARDAAGQRLQLPLNLRIAEGDADVVPSLSANPPALVALPDLSASGPGEDFPDEALQAIAVDAYGQTYGVGFAFHEGDYDAELIKTDAAGRLLWRRRIDAGGREYGYGVAVEPRGQTVYVVGYGLVGAEYQAFVFHYDTRGSLLQERWIRTGHGVDALYAVAADRQRVCAAGERYNGRTFDPLVSCFTHALETQWIRTGPSPATETAYALALRPCPGEPPAPSCGVLVGGSRGSAQDRGWLRVYRPESGETRAETGLDDMPVEAMVLLGRDVVLGGTTAAGDWRIRRLDAALESRWARSLTEGDRLRALATDSRGFLYAGGRGAGPGGADGLLVLLDPTDGRTLDLLRVDRGGDERIFGAALQPNDVLVLAGRQGTATSRVLLLFLETEASF